MHTQAHSGFDPNIHLSVGDVSMDSQSAPTYLAVNIKASKTDPFCQGVTVYLGKTHDQICPVAAMLNYLVVRGTSKGPLFIFQRWNSPHICNNFVSAVHMVLSAAGVDTVKVCGSQLLYWGCHHGSKTRHPGLPY